jgi:hypothetical protein
MSSSLTIVLEFLNRIVMLYQPRITDTPKIKLIDVESADTNYAFFSFSCK